MQNFIQSGKVLSLIAPAGGVKAGEFVVVGGLHGFAITDAAEGEIVSVSREGVFSAPKAGVEIHQGDKLYWDVALSSFTTNPTGANLAVAVADAGAQDQTVSLVLLDNAEALNPGDITGVTAGTGLIGGGTSGEVMLAVDTTVIPTRSDLASNDTGKGASMVGIEDVGGNYAATTVEDALTEIATEALFTNDFGTKDITIPVLSSSGSSEADPGWVGATILSAVPVSGVAESHVASVTVGVDGAVTVTLGGNQSAGAATIRVFAALQ